MLEGGYWLVNYAGTAGYAPGDNVVHLFVMGALAPEVLAASDQLLEQGIFANVAVVTSMMPTKGISHPLLSYGGSNLVISLVSIGIVVSLSKSSVSEPTTMLDHELTRPDIARTTASAVA